MKSKILVFISVMLLFSGHGFSREESKSADAKGTITILASPGLTGLVTLWADKYTAANPEYKIRVKVAREVKTANFEGEGADFGFFPGNQAESSPGKSLWKMTVGRDITVPVVSSKNPFLEELNQKGITAEKLAGVFNNAGKESWGGILGNSQNNPVHIYMLADQSVQAAIKKYLKLENIPAGVVTYASAEEVISAVQNDPYSIGICKMVCLVSPDKESMVENIKLLPIDKNANGKIDYMEKIYDNLDVFARGVWIGKYPKALSTDVYFVSAAQPSGKADISFLKWVITSGQQYLPASGLSDLVYSERQSKIDKFNGIDLTPPSKEIYSFPVITILVLATIVVLSILISIILFFRKGGKPSISIPGEAAPGVFNEDSVIIPRGLYFGKTHTWVFMEKDGMVRVGIDDFLQHITGRVSRLEMKKPGEKVKKGDIVLSIIQKGKQLNIYSPVSGTIFSQNRALIAETSLLNSSPYKDGWVYMIEPSNWLRDIQFLDMAEKYKVWLLNEFSRLKDFLAGSLKVNKLEYEHVVLQDGGFLKDSILEDLGPEVWEDFQTHFLDTNKN